MRALLLAATVCLAVAPATQVKATELAQDAARMPFGEWLQGFRAEALNKGIDAAALDRGLANVSTIDRVLELDKRQPEFMLTLWRYLELYVPDARIEKGKALLQTHAKLLKEIENKYGVPARFLVAFWGVETDFGRNFGSFRMIDAVATLAYDARRADFFRSQLMSAMRLVAAGDVTPETMSSWAGAMGNMQFIPSTFEAYAVDYDGDGRRDLWNNLGDALASAANYLSSVGWERDYTWGREVKLPGTFDWSIASLGTKKPIAEWAKLGVRRADGSALPNADLEASILLPAGASGPAFMVYKNFRVIMRWNTSQLYAIAVGHLADRMIGLPKLSVSKPAGEQMLKVEDISEIQRLLSKAGFDTGGVDGRAGPMTRTAIRGFQKSIKLPADGHPTFGLLERLRAATGG